MLSAHEYELLTGFVDGELSPRQRRQADRLLRRSEEARALLARLLDDAGRVRALPPVPMPADLTGPVLAALSGRRQAAPCRVVRPAPAPVIRVPARRPRRLLQFPAWAGAAIAAAAVFLVIGLGSFLLNRPLAPTTDGPSASRPGALRSEAPPAVAPQPEPRHLAQAGPERGSERPGPLPEPPSTGPHTLPSPPAQEEKPLTQYPPRPERRAEPVLTSGEQEDGRGLERATPALPSIYPAHRLDQSDDGQRLLAQLRSAPGFRLELPSRDATRALDRLRGLLTARKAELVLDPVAQARLKTPVWRTDYAVFVENVSPDALASLLCDLGVADRKASQKKPAEQRLEGHLIVQALAPLDRKALTDLLGIDPVGHRPAAPSTPKLDIRRPLPELTGQQVSDALQQGRTARPGAAPRLSVYAAPLGSRARTAELKRYLGTRAPAQPGTVQALIVFRSL